MELSPGDENVVKSFLHEVNSQRAAPLPWKDGVKFCMARKFNRERAVQLFRNHENDRDREGLNAINLRTSEVRKELVCGKLTVLGTRDSQGAAIALFTARFHNSVATTRKTTLQSLVTQVDAALDSVETQRNGIVFIYDMTDSKFSNFEYDLCTKILDLLKDSFPARLKKVLIVLAPLWFKAPFKILKMFIKDKLRDRVYTVNDSEILQHIPIQALPRHLGGQYLVNHKAWLSHCLTTSGWKPENIRTYLKDAEEPYYYTSKFPPTAIPPIVQHSQRNGSNSAPAYPAPPPPPRTSSMEPNGGHNGPSIQQPVLPSHQFVESPTSPMSVPNIGPSWSDKDPFESAFNAKMSELITPQQQFEQVQKLGQPGLQQDYDRLRQVPIQDTIHNFKMVHNREKNRYTDVVCVDYTRVVLNSGDQYRDYINANHVNSFEQKRGYICCQGPLPQTFIDFWMMVWQEKSKTIVMTTRLVERARLKCGPYWPQEENAVEDYGNIQVMNTEIKTEEDFHVTTLLVRNLETDEIRFIKHLLFVKWPDFGIPPSPDSFLHFVKAVRNIQAVAVKDMPEWKGHPRGPPIIVHCSAGIGRTGTFVTSDICMYMLDTLHKVNIAKVVRLIRQQRAGSVQTAEQYAFTHLAVLSYAQKQGLLDRNIDIRRAILSGTVDSD